MRIISCFIVVLFFFNLTIVIGQKNKFDTLNFIPIYGSIPLKIDDAFYAFKDKDSIQFDELKFYISEVELINGNKLVWKEPNSYHLIDASNLKSLQIILNIPQNISFQKVKFSLGVDSIVNVSGVKGGDLDPTNGMYWAWQSGYINFKLEGKSNLCKTNNNEFSFHLGGYQYPFYVHKSVILDFKKNSNTEIIIDLKKMMDYVDFAQQNHIMSPSNQAVLMYEKALEIFSNK